MAEIKSFPFDSQITGYTDEGYPILDRASDAETFRKIFGQYFTNGVFMNPSTNFQVVSGTGNAVIIKAGRCNINGATGFSDSNVTIALESSSGQPRYDRVVLRLDDNIAVRKIVPIVLKGVPSTNPAVPALTRNTTIHDLGIATIYRPANIGSINQANIADTRMDTTVCGTVSCTIKEADTATLYKQMQADLAGFKSVEQAEFLKWFDQIKGQLSTDQAGNLQNQINGVKSKLEKALFLR